MAVRGFFYNATDLNDKEHMYNGQDMNEDKAPFYKEGVAYGHLQVTAAGGSMEVVVDGGTRTGYAYINLHTIHNTAPLTLTLSQASGTLPRIDRTLTNTTTGTVQTAEVTKSGIGFYVTEAGEYTVESNMESVMAIPKKFKADNTDLMHTITIALREGTNMAYIGNYIGTYLLKESEEKRR